MNPQPTPPPVGGNALMTILRHADSHRALAETDAYSAQEAPRLERAYSQVAELIAADKEYDEANEAWNMRCSIENGRRLDYATARRAAALAALEAP